MQRPPQDDDWFGFSAYGRRFEFRRTTPPDTIQQDMMAYGTFYEAAELAFLKAFIPPAARIVDVGANIGNHAVFFDLVCGAEVIVFEPNPTVIPELQMNLARNACSRTDTGHLGKALGFASFRGELYLREADRAANNRGGTRLRPAPNGAIDVYPLDKCLRAPVDLIKIDVEGMAIDVLRGAEQIIAESPRPMLFVEIEAPQENAFRKWMTQHHYTERASFVMYEGLRNYFCLPQR